jgi:hypothetical protein
MNAPSKPASDLAISPIAAFWNGVLAAKTGRFSSTFRGSFGGNDVPTAEAGPRGDDVRHHVSLRPVTHPACLVF